jgi:hypothetical protein
VINWFRPTGDLVGISSVSLASAYRRKLAHSTMPPLPAKPASLGFGGGPNSQRDKGGKTPLGAADNGILPVVRYREGQPPCSEG